MPRFQMERIVFDTMEFYEDGAIAVALLWRADIDRTGADMDDLDSIASLTRQIEGVPDRHHADRKQGQDGQGLGAHNQGDGRSRNLQKVRRRRAYPGRRRDL